MTKTAKEAAATSGDSKTAANKTAANKTIASKLPAADIHAAYGSLIDLCRAESLDWDEEEILHRHMEALARHFPGRQFAIGLLDALEDGALRLVLANGQIRERRRTEVVVSKRGMPQGVEPGPGVRVAEAYELAFEGTDHGFDVALREDTTFTGFIIVEYATGYLSSATKTEVIEADRNIVWHWAQALSHELTKARIASESVHVREYLGQLLEHANAPIVVLDPSRTIQVANRAFLEFVGDESIGAIGSDFAEALAPRDRDRFDPVLARALRGMPTADHECSLLAPRGTLSVSLNVAAMANADGDIEGAVVVGRDLTEVRRLQEQVVQNEKLATLGRLATGVVHELNNPLTSIRAYGEYLLGKTTSGGPGSDFEKLTRIVEGANRILRFTRDLVTYARPSSEAPVPVDLHELLDQAVVFCEHVIEEHGSRVARHYADTSRPVLAVKGQMHQVFINLITNACHAMPLGAGSLTIRTAFHEGRNLAEIRVKDNGKGIATEDCERIFEPFYSTKGEGKGTGLGLSIVRNLLEQHGGTIRVESEVGSGTVFTVTVPLVPTAKRP